MGLHALSTFATTPAAPTAAAPYPFLSSLCPSRSTGSHVARPTWASATHGWCTIKSLPHHLGVAEGGKDRCSTQLRALGVAEPSHISGAGAWRDMVRRVVGGGRLLPASQRVQLRLRPRPLLSLTRLLSLLQLLRLLLRNGLQLRLLSFIVHAAADQRLPAACLEPRRRLLLQPWCQCQACCILCSCHCLLLSVYSLLKGSLLRSSRPCRDANCKGRVGIHSQRPKCDGTWISTQGQMLRRKLLLWQRLLLR